MARVNPSLVREEWESPPAEHSTRLLSTAPPSWQPPPYMPSYANHDTPSTTAHHDCKTSPLHLNIHSLIIRSHPRTGRGVYASRPLTAGTLIEVSPVLVFPAEEYHQHGQHTQLDSYTFIWKRAEAGRNHMALALGLGSLFNHHPTSPNVSYSLHHATNSIHYTLVRDVAPGDELCISYGAGRMWWEAKEEEEEAVQQERPDGADEWSRLAAIAFQQDEVGGGGDDGTAVELRPPNAAGSSPPLPHSPTPKAPLWRLTAAIDPSTAPMPLVAAWVVDIPPRLSSTLLKWVRHHQADLCESLRAAYEEAQSGAVGDDEDEQEAGQRALLVAAKSIHHLRALRKSESTDAASSRLTALLCLRAHGPARERLCQLLAAELVAPGWTPEPYLVDVPACPAPSKARLPAWCAAWPTVLRNGPDATAAITAATAAPPPSPVRPLPAGGVNGTSAAHIKTTVDRAQDDASWTPDRVQWAQDAFRRCLRVAREAKARGEVAVGVHVTSSPEPGGAGGAPHAPPFRVDGCDTRVSARNPIKHAVTNAIRAVAALRAEAVRGPAGAELVRADSPGSDGVPRTQRHAAGAGAGSGARTPPPPPTPANGSANGTDYLLTSLSLFSTHEPCAYCCMALVHSRVRALYFLQPAPGSGGCCGAGADAQHGGPYAIHEQQGLNHRFEVWRWTGSREAFEREVGGTQQLSELLDVGGLDL